MTESRRITSIEALPNDPLMMEVRLDDTVLGILARDVVDRFELEVGLSEDDTRVRDFSHAVACQAAREKALELLAVHDRASGGLVSRLVDGGFDRDVAEDTVTELRDDGWIDDTAYATRRLETLRNERGGSSEVCREKLLKEGVPEPVVDEALTSDGEQDEELEAACTALQRSMAKSSRNADGSPEAIRRLAGTLQRQGFDPDTMRAAFARLDLEVPEDF